MLFSLFRELRHFLFDDARVHPIATRGQLFLCDFLQQFSIPPRQAMFAASALRQAAPQNLQRGGKRQTPRIDFLQFRRLHHRFAYNVVRQQQTVDFLDDAGDRLAAQRRSFLLVRFQKQQT